MNSRTHCNKKIIKIVNGLNILIGSNTVSADKNNLFTNGDE